jgi:hypothetical protein
MNPNKVWQEITISDEELEEIIAGIPKTRRGQRRNLFVNDDASLDDDEDEEDD